MGHDGEKVHVGLSDDEDVNAYYVTSDDEFGNFIDNE